MFAVCLETLPYLTALLCHPYTPLFITMSPLCPQTTEQEKPVIDKKLLDYDYGDESDEDDKPAKPGDNM